MSLMANGYWATTIARARETTGIIKTERNPADLQGLFEDFYDDVRRFMDEG